MKKNKKFLLPLLLILSIFIGVYAASTFNWSGSNNDANTIGNDTWTMTGDIDLNPSEASVNRGTISNISVHSDLFGDFTEKSGNVNLKNSTENDCGTSGEETYKIEGNLVIESDSWGDMSLDQSTSYYCPGDGELYVEFKSDSLGTKIVGGQNILYTLIEVPEVGIKGVSSVKGDLSKLKNYNGEIFDLKFTTSEGKSYNMNTTLSKNITKVTKGISPITSEYSIDKFEGNNISKNKYYYYNYEGKTRTDNPLGNKGKNVIIEDNIDNKVEVNGINVLIVEGGNVYINSNIYSSDDTKDLLVIVVKRDETNKQNGGNIYVNPSVTNIDAVLVADGSLLSYDGTKVLNAIDNPDDLRYQLFIYGRLITKNTIGENKTIFGTDDYIVSGIEEDSNYYNLANLRSHIIAYASTDSGEDCGGNSSKIISLEDNGAGNYSPIKYAFAGKRECFSDDKTNDLDLRKTDMLNPLSIEKNTNLELLSPNIFIN